MFESDRVIFLQLHKTGTTTIVDELQRCTPGRLHKNRQQGKHMALNVPQNGRLVLGSIRNPYDWYLSLWAYGCAGKGELAWYLKADPLRAGLAFARNESSPRRPMAPPCNI